MANPEVTNIDSRTLEAGDNKYRQEVLLSGENVLEGEVLGYVSASQKLGASGVADVDGREFASVIAAEDKDASGGDEPITVIYAGDVDDQKLVFDGAETLDTVVAGQPYSFKQLLRNAGIYANAYPAVLIEDNQ